METTHSGLPADIGRRFMRGLELFDLMVSALHVVLKDEYPSATDDEIRELTGARVEEIRRWMDSSDYRPVYPKTREVYTIEWWERQCAEFPGIAGLP